MSGLFDTAYVIVGPSGARAVIGNSIAAQADADFVGVLTEPPSGLDSAEVREAGEDLPGLDGGLHGAFFYGRRPVTFPGQITRDVTSWIPWRDKLKQAIDAMRADGTVTWTEAGVAKMFWFRQQQPLRITGTRPKDFLVALVSANDRIVAAGAEKTSGPSTSLSVTNDGKAGAWPRFTIASPGATVNITNNTTGKTLTFTGLSGGGTVTIDFAPSQRPFTVVQGGTSKRGAVAFPTSVWWELVPGVNSISITNAASVFFRDSW